MAILQTDIEDARQRLAEGLQRVREQADHIERLYRDGKSVKSAVELLATMRGTVSQLETHLRFLMETQGRHE